jgi:hypothetical protein
MFSFFSWPRLMLFMALLSLLSLPLHAQELSGLKHSFRDHQSDKGKPKKGGGGPSRPKPKPGPQEGGDDD